MKTTVVIPNYNGIEYLKGCLETLEKSTVELSVVVVDNGSKDGSREWVSAHYPGARLLAFSENRGFCEAVNAGIRAAKTPYVFLLNNDTRVERDCVERLEAAMERDLRIFSVGARMLCMYAPDRIDGAGDLYCALGWAFAVGKGKPKDRVKNPGDVFSNCAGAALYRRAYLEKTGLFDETHFAYLEDVDLGYRARIMGYRNVTEPSAVVYHAGSAFSGSRYNEFKISHSARNNVYLIYKNMPVFQILLNLPFLLAGFLIKQIFFTARGFGGVYARGLREGVRLCASEKGRRKKVPFRMRNAGNYARIQWELWRNLFWRL